MNNNTSSFPISIETFSTAVVVGAGICLLINIIELEYSIVALFDPSAPSAGSGQIVGGLVAGFLYAGTRRGALKAGGYAGGLPVVVLGPVAIVLNIGTQSTVFTPGFIALQYVLGFFVVYPFMIGTGMLFGGLGGAVGYWVSKKLA